MSDKPKHDKWKPGDYCDRCNNTGEIDCHCGGDLCVCGRQELECPRCDGRAGIGSYYIEHDEDDYDFHEPTPAPTGSETT